MSNSHRYIRFFKDIGIEDVPRVGGKNASLGEMFREMSAQGVRVPNGFAITADAYWYTLERAGAMPLLKQALAGLDPANVGDLATRAHKMREIVYGAGLPEDLSTEILAPYRSLQDGVGLVRMEFIINESIKVHPMALVHPEKVEDPIERAAIDKLTRGYATRADFFVEPLSEGVGTIAAAFYPKPVIVRMSDFEKSLGRRSRSSPAPRSIGINAEEVVA